MAWNPSPKVADCREIARKWGNKHQVIVLAIDRDARTLEMATYGATKEQCKAARELGDAAYDAVIQACDPDSPVITQATVNARWLIERLDRVHDALCPDKCGTWQQRADQSAEAAEGIANASAHPSVPASGEAPGSQSQSKGE